MFVFVSSVVVALVVSFVCSISEATLLSVGHARVLALKKTRAGRILAEFKRQIDVPIAAILVLNTFANTIGAAVAGAKYAELFGTPTLWLFSLLFTLAVLIFSEIVPKTLGVSFAAKLAAPVALLVRVLVSAFRPLLVVTRAIASVLTRGSERPTTSIEEIRLLAAVGRTEGALGKRVAAMIEGAAALRDLTAYDVLVPRSRMMVLSGARTLEENLEIVRSTGHSRFPFTATGELDAISGMVLTKDLLFALRDGGEPRWADLVGALPVVPSTLPLDRLLSAFQEQRRHLALVVDEYGGTQGLVTLEDVLEEIVGEIDDESDRLDPTIQRKADGSLLCRGWCEVRKVADLLSITDEADDVDAVTIGGLVAELIGRIPKKGDEVQWHGHTLVVVRASARRAERVEVRPKSAAPAP